MKQILLFFLIGVFFAACTEEQRAETIISIDNPNFKDWGSLFSIEDVAIMENPDTSFLSIAAKCLVGKHTILFSDYKSKELYAYSKKGKFLFKVGGIGHSESEYTSLRDVQFNYSQTQIEILDERGIILYDAKNGKFIKRKRNKSFTEKDFYGFLPLDNNSYLLFSPHAKDYSIWLYENEKFNGIREKKSYGLVFNHFLRQYENVLIAPDYGMFTIDGYKEGKLFPKYEIKITDHSFPSDKLPQTASEFDKIDNEGKYFTFISSMLENDSILYVSVIGPSHMYYDIFYNKHTKKIISGPRSMDMGLTLVGLDNSYFYGIVYPDYMSEKCPIYNKLKEYIDINVQNPLLVKIKLNDL